MSGRNRKACTEFDRLTLEPRIEVAISDFLLQGFSPLERYRRCHPVDSDLGMPWALV